jgi:membrane protein implicated in regulation of membrane protease activity
MTAKPRTAVTRDDALNIVAMIVGFGLILASALGPLPRWFIGLGAVVILHSTEKFVVTRTGRRLAGEPAFVTEDCNPRGKVEIEGRIWKAASKPGAPAKAGTWARVRGATWGWHGLLLEVESSERMETAETTGRRA